MKVLVLGGTGAMGTPLCKMLSDAGHEVVVTTRKYRESVGNINYIAGDAHDNDFLLKVLTSKNWYDAVIDFLVHNTSDLKRKLDMILPNTGHYIFTSSARVYAPCEGGITEETPRLLDSCDDEEYLRSNEYAIIKARQENLLFSSGKKNWTIIRPTLTYNTRRLQFALGEKDDWLFRALNGRSIVFPSDMKDIKTTMVWGDDVARAITLLIRNEKAMGEVVHLASEEAYSWGDILEIYQNVLEKKIGHRSNIFYVENALSVAKVLGSYYQAKYARCVSREFDSSKLRAIVGDFSFTSAKDGLSRCLGEFLENPVFELASWKTQAYFDRITGERTSLTEFGSIKRKVAYIATRYFGYK